MAKAKSARSRSVKTVVWVRKPGPMAEVAMRNAAPTAAPAAFPAAAGSFVSAAPRGSPTVRRV